MVIIKGIWLNMDPLLMSHRWMYPIVWVCIFKIMHPLRLRRNYEKLLKWVNMLYHDMHDWYDVFLDVFCHDYHVSWSGSCHFTSMSLSLVCMFSCLCHTVSNPCHFKSFHISCMHVQISHFGNIAVEEVIWCYVTCLHERHACTYLVIQLSLTCMCLTCCYDVINHVCIWLWWSCHICGDFILMEHPYFRMTCDMCVTTSMIYCFWCHASSPISIIICATLVLFSRDNFHVWIIKLIRIKHLQVFVKLQHFYQVGMRDALQGACA